MPEFKYKMIRTLFLLLVLVGSGFGRSGDRGVLFHSLHIEETRSAAGSDMSGGREDLFDSKVVTDVSDSQEAAESLPYIKDTKDCCFDNKHCDVLTRDGKIDTRPCQVGHRCVDVPGLWYGWCRDEAEWDRQRKTDSKTCKPEGHQCNCFPIDKNCVDDCCGGTQCGYNYETKPKFASCTKTDAPRRHLLGK